MVASCSGFDVLVWLLVALNHHFTLRPYVGTVAIVALCQQGRVVARVRMQRALPPPFRTDMDAYLAARFRAVRRVGVWHPVHPPTAARPSSERCSTTRAWTICPVAPCTPRCPAAPRFPTSRAPQRLRLRRAESERFEGHAARATTPVRTAHCPQQRTCHASLRARPSSQARIPLSPAARRSPRHGRARRKRGKREQPAQTRRTTAQPSDHRP